MESKIDMMKFYSKNCDLLTNGLRHVLMWHGLNVQEFPCGYSLTSSEIYITYPSCGDCVRNIGECKVIHGSDIKYGYLPLWNEISKN